MMLVTANMPNVLTGIILALPLYTLNWSIGLFTLAIVISTFKDRHFLGSTILLVVIAVIAFLAIISIILFFHSLWNEPDRASRPQANGSGGNAHGQQTSAMGTE